ncbi:SulP family inorganic anion transporter [Streptomyces sp. GKU 257-1]|nr:SulP family inorganic anion transporter [Streptomyces sp. GKU 257-1]
MSHRPPVLSGPRAAPDHPPTPRQRWSADLSASVTVFLIALPLSLGIALAAGAPLQSGLVAAAVGGVVCGRLGGAPLQVTGPAAGLTVITAELIQRYGWQTTCAITVLAGAAQVGLGFLRVARSALAVSPAVVHGMLAGIGCTITLAQLHVMLGGDPDSSPLTNALELPGRITAVQPAALSVSSLTVVVLLAWPRLRQHGGARSARPRPAYPPRWPRSVWPPLPRCWPAPGCPASTCPPGVRTHFPDCRRARCSDWARQS